MTPDLSMQLYSARNFPPLASQLAVLADLGYRNVEPFRALYDDVPGLVAALETHGLSARSAHFSVELLEKDFARSIEIAQALGTEIVVLPYLLPAERPSDAAGWAAFAGRVRAIAAKVASEGLRTAWHNHDFEMVALPGGSRPIEHILGAGVEWEADAAWIVRAGEDPKAWIERYDGQIAAVHVKDIAPRGENADEDGWADVGHGTLDWQALWDAGQKAGAELMIAEHDNPSDFRRFAARSAAAMTSFGGGA
jgi:sugar phosphate isomerase/epimerase